MFSGAMCSCQERQCLEWQLPAESCSCTYCQTVRWEMKHQKNHSQKQLCFSFFSLLAVLHFRFLTWHMIAEYVQASEIKTDILSESSRFLVSQEHHPTKLSRSKSVSSHLALTYVSSDHVWSTLTSPHYMEINIYVTGANGHNVYTRR